MELDFGPPVEAWAPQLGVWGTGFWAACGSVGPQLGVWSAADTALFGVKSFSCWMIGYT